MDNRSENGSRLNRSRIIQLLLSGFSLLLLAIAGITLKHASIEQFILDAEWPAYLLVTVLLLTPWILFKSSRSTLYSIIFFTGLYLLFELNFLHDGSKIFWGDTSIFHVFSFWYFGNSIALGFGIPEWFPSQGGIPVGPLSVTLFFLMPHRLLGYTLYTIFPLEPIVAFNLQLLLGIVFACVGWWCVLFKLTRCRLSATFGVLTVILGGAGLTLHHEQTIATMTWLPWILLALFYIRKHSSALYILSILIGFSLATHQPQIHLITLLAIFVSVFLFSREGFQDLKSFVAFRKPRHFVIAVLLILSAACSSVYLYAVKNDFASGFRTSDDRSVKELGAESWEDYVILNRQQNSSASKNSMLQLVFPDYRAGLDFKPGSNHRAGLDHFLFFVSRISLFFAVLSLFLKHRYRFPIFLCTVFLGLCCLGINGPVSRILFELRFPFIHYFRQWYHFGPLFLFGISALAAMGFCSSLKIAEKKIPRSHHYVAVVCFSILLFELLTYGAQYNKLNLVPLQEPWPRLDRKTYLQILSSPPGQPVHFGLDNNLRGSMFTRIMNFKTRSLLEPAWINHRSYLSEDSTSVSKLPVAEQLSEMKRRFAGKKSFPGVTLVDAPEEVLDSSAKNSGGQPPLEIMEANERDDEHKIHTVINPEGARIELKLEEPALLVTPFNYENNFRGFLDGEEIEVWRANANMAAIFLPAGQHLLELKLRDGFYNICMLIQGIFLAAAVLMAMRLIWISKNNSVSR